MPKASAFWERLVLSGDCWLFTGAKTHNGYGKVKVSGQCYRAHRFVWSFFYGDIPSGLEIDHLCRNRACVNPAHLEPVPSVINKARAILAAHQGGIQTHCKRDHEFTPENTYAWRGRRKCRACQRIYNRARKA